MEKDVSQGNQNLEPDQGVKPKDESGEHFKIKVLGTLIEGKKVTVKLIILVTVVFLLSIVLVGVLQGTIRF